MKRVIIALIITVLIAIFAISITHFYSVRILSACRAYTNFESQYSKGETDACRHLINYIHSHEETDYLFFKSDISIPQGARIARKALVTGEDSRIARIGFLLAGNQRDDLPKLIWFFQQFKDEFFFKSTIKTWQQADELVGKLNTVGLLAYKNISSGKLKNKDDLILEVNTISDNLTINQRNFSTILGVTFRMVDHYVFIINLFISAIILGCSALLTGIMLERVYKSKQVIVDQNKVLTNMNARINKFAYTVTHDLQAPLASLTGLVSVLEREKDITQISSYTEMMRESLLLQDKYIHDVLHTIQNQNEEEEELCNLTEILNDVMSQNNFFVNGKKVKFLIELELRELKVNVTDMKVVFNNLVSNSIKYADFNKPEQWIKVKSYQKDQRCIIEIEDNGLGIKSEQKGSIFNKFFKSSINKKSTGLGLYFTKQAVEEMNGTISVKSLLGIGTSFIISLPL